MADRLAGHWAIGSREPYPSTRGSAALGWGGIPAQKPTPTRIEIATEFFMVIATGAKIGGGLGVGADKHEKRKHGGALPAFVPCFVATLDTPAWRAMSHGARNLYIALKRRWFQKSHNNGRIFLSQRIAAKELGSHHNEVARWFRELQHFGFIVMTTPGNLGVEGKGKAPHWRLTELGTYDAFPTRDYERWDGSKFVDRKTKSRAPIPARGVPDNQHGGVPENLPRDSATVLEIQHIHEHKGVPENQHISSLPLPSATPASSTPALKASSYLLAAIERKDARAKRAPQGAVASERVINGRE